MPEVATRICIARQGVDWLNDRASEDSASKVSGKATERCYRNRTRSVWLGGLLYAHARIYIRRHGDSGP